MATHHLILRIIISVFAFLLLVDNGNAGAGNGNAGAGNGNAGASDAIGHIKTVSGDAHIRRGSAVIPAALGAPLHMYDGLETGLLGALGVIFIDNTRISIGNDTEFIIDEYVYRPKTMALSFLSRISRGTLHFISGNMAKLKPGAIAVKTPGGTIGIRGTRFLVKVQKGS